MPTTEISLISKTMIKHILICQQKVISKSMHYAYFSSPLTNNISKLKQFTYYL